MEISPLDLSQVEDLLRLYDSYERPKDEPLSNEAVASIVARIRQQGGEVFVAIHGGKVMGTYAIYICQNLTRSGKPFAVVENVICAPENRRQGIGTELMNHAKAYAQAQGCFKITLQTGHKWEGNHAFYEACGFNFDKRGYQVRFQH